MSKSSREIREIVTTDGPRTDISWKTDGGEMIRISLETRRDFDVLREILAKLSDREIAKIREVFTSTGHVVF
jgi:hypothetical protein